MKQTNFSILFYIVKSRILKNGEAPIIIRITIDGKDDESRIMRSINPAQWDQKKGQSKGRSREAAELNSYIKELDNRVRAITKT